MQKKYRIANWGFNLSIEKKESAKSAGEINQNNFSGHLSYKRKCTNSIFEKKH